MKIVNWIVAHKFRLLCGGIGAAISAVLFLCGAWVREEIQNPTLPDRGFVLLGVFFTALLFVGGYIIGTILGRDEE